jgi:hypothetical protein
MLVNLQVLLIPSFLIKCSASKNLCMGWTRHIEHDFSGLPLSLLLSGSLAPSLTAHCLSISMALAWPISRSMWMTSSRLHLHRICYTVRLTLFVPSLVWQTWRTNMWLDG